VDAKGLGIKEATVHPRATENIDAIIEMIKKLEEKGFAYNVTGCVFQRQEIYRIRKLSHQSLEDLELGARIDVDERKKDPMDFALWKAQKPGEPAWTARGEKEGRAGILNALPWQTVSWRDNRHPQRRTGFGVSPPRE